MIQTVILLIPIPIIGTIVRYRATYYPKSNLGVVDAEIALPLTPNTVDTPSSVASKDSAGLEAAVADVAGPNKAGVAGLTVVDDKSTVNQVPELTSPPTFFSVMKSVWNQEHIAGTFRGIFPGLYFSVIFFRFYVSPGPAVFQRTHYSAFFWNLLYIPYLVATYRIIVCQQKLNFGAPKSVFGALFSEYERAHPFRALRHSPLILPFLCVLCIDLFIVPTLRNAIGNIGDITEGFDPSEEKLYVMRWTELVSVVWHHIVWKTVAQIVAFPLLAVVMTVAMAPVDVVLTRLAIQPVQAEPVEERESEKMVTVAPPSYLHLTTEQRPYANFLDCFQRIRKEEGWGVFYRAWFLTFLGYCHPVLR